VHNVPDAHRHENESPAWLGHESVETTQIYLDANLAIKEEILAKTTPINAKGGPYRPDDDLLAFLKGL
jgi:hypothetical protein